MHQTINRRYQLTEPEIKEAIRQWLCDKGLRVPQEFEDIITLEPQEGYTQDDEHVVPPKVIAFAVWNETGVVS